MCLKMRAQVPAPRNMVGNNIDNKADGSSKRNPNPSAMTVDDLNGGMDQMSVNDATVLTNTNNNNFSSSSGSAPKRETEHEHGSIGASRLAKARQKVMAAKKMAGLSKFSSRLEANKRNPDEQ